MAHDMGFTVEKQMMQQDISPNESEIKQHNKISQQYMYRKHPLRWLILLWLGVIFLQLLQSQITGALQALAPDTPLSDDAISKTILSLFIFSFLMILHISFHWFVLFREKIINRHFLLLYFLLQGIFLLPIVLILRMDNSSFGLYLALIIEAITLLQASLLTTIVVCSYLVFYLLTQSVNLFTFTQKTNFASMFQDGSWTYAAPKWIDAILSGWTLIFFVLACFIIYMQQTKAHQRDRDLLHKLENTHEQLKQAHDQLETAHIQLEDYAARIEDLTLATERQRMARELHDTLAQGLVGLTMQLETVDSLLTKQHCEQARIIVQQAMKRARATITSARAAITDLRTKGLAEEDFTSRIKAELENFTNATGIAYDCSFCIYLSDTYHEHLERIVSEGLTNIARHSQATRAWIHVYAENNTITFEIGDNGIGFDPANIGTGHYGLLGLRERARLMNGQLIVISTRAIGTILRLHLPKTPGGPVDE